MLHCAEEMKRKHFPALFISSKTDKIVVPATALAMSEACGLTEEERVELDEKYNPVSGPSGIKLN